MDYKDFQINDFLRDEYFVNWVLHPDFESDHFWKQWLTAHPEKHAVLEQAREIISSVGYKNHFELGDLEYAAMFEAVLKANHKRNNQGINWVSLSWKIAASLLLVLAGVLAAWQFGSNQHTDVQMELIVAKTEYGQKKTVVLSDGTKVMLNAGSQLIYPKKFDGESREVSLTGEAFFDVHRDETHPFIIQTSGLTTQVLGTSFNVRGYDEDLAVRVSVVTGKVRVTSVAGESAYLIPEQMGVFSKENQSINVTSFDENEFVGWTEGLLIFENETLPDIFQKLERWYGVTILVDEGVKLEGHYSGSYKNKSLMLVLEGISYTSHLKYELNQKTITIHESK